MLPDLQTALSPNKRLLLFGMGVENTQFLDWLLTVLNIPIDHLILADQNPDTLAKITQNGTLGFKTYHTDQFWDSLQDPSLSLVVKTPGIWSKRPEFENFRQTHGQESIISSLAFFLEKFQSQCIGITGTKGKSTTSSLTRHLLQAGLDHVATPNQTPAEVYYCGNTTGISPYKYWIDMDQTPKAHQWFVLELSSFQLQDLGYSKLSPHLAGITNYYVDHLDQHQNKQEYWGTKDNIFTFQDASGTLIASEQVRSRSTQANDCPRAVFVDTRMIDELQNILHIPLPGIHNAYNTAIALLLAAQVIYRQTDLTPIGQDQTFWQSALNNYQPLPYRQQIIASTDTQLNLPDLQVKRLKINFINDGYATEPDAVAAAIQTFTQNPGEFIWLQITGKDKGSEVETIIQAIWQAQNQNRLYRVDYCGTVGQRILQHIYQTSGLNISTPIQNFRQLIRMDMPNLSQIQAQFLKWLQEQIQESKDIQDPSLVDTLNLGDQITLNVLLSPAGSSFDEFNNATERADWWSQQVTNILPN